MASEDEEERWTVSIGDGSLRREPALESGLDVKSFFDSASTVTRSDSLSSFPGAFLLSRSTSSATAQTGRIVASPSKPKLSLKAQAQAQARAFDGASTAGYDQESSGSMGASVDHFSRVPKSSFGAANRRRVAPPALLLSPSITTASSDDCLERGFYDTQHDSEQQPRRRHHQEDSADRDNKAQLRQRQLHLFDQHLLPEQRPFSSWSAVEASSVLPDSPPPPPPPPKDTPSQPPKRMRHSLEDTTSTRPAPAMAMTREEFEALPPTIQRKYFSTLERLRFAQDSCLSYYSQPHSASEAAQQSSSEPNPAPGSSAPNAQDSRPRITSTDLRFYANLPDKIKRRHLTEEEQLVAQRHRQSVILDAADEALVRIGKRQSCALLRQDEDNDSIYPADQGPWALESAQDVAPNHKMEGSLYESFRWLDEDEDLDLRLFLDDYHINLREEVPLPATNRRPTFRRHLSVSKLPFGRSSLSSGRPAAKDNSWAEGASGGVATPRRRSRTLSMMSPSKQTLPEPPTTIDHLATHYQDPEARMKLRVYLASPQKFDEAIEFGFPSIDHVQGVEEKSCKRATSRQQLVDDADKLCTFLDDDDDRSFANSDLATTPDTDSPPTPDLADKPLPIHLGRVKSDLGVKPTLLSSSTLDYAHAPASSREMTLRMTLTRPDLRNHEDQIYGWQRDSMTSRGHGHNKAMPSPSYSEGPAKRSIEKHNAFFANEEDGFPGTESGVVKRFWNRVRRT
ncbi:hypothetical protein S40293_06144 [Stachybotrys chartarum IBT 40293]|nr:hypothetical protein S40293_06144 [Stachybotrys chartarum IBT 40293]